MEMLQLVHSHMRYLVVLAFAVTALRYLYGWLAGRTFADLDRTLWTLFQGIFGLQVLLGLFLLLGGITRHRAEHVVAMVVAFGLTHMAGRFADAPDAARFRNLFLLLCVAFALVFAGVARLLGWNWLVP